MSSRAWYISDIIENKGTIVLDTMGIEYTLIELSGIGQPYMVTGFIDLSNMIDDSELYLREYIGFDAGEYKKYLSYRFRGVQIDPLMLITPKYLMDNDKYKLTLLLSSGSYLEVPYKIIVFKYTSREL